MANRILRDWTCSETVNELSESAEIFFTRLIMKADDFGRFYGSSKLLKAQLFPLKDYMFKQVESWRDECVNSGILKMYLHDEKEFLEIVDFNQRLRLMKSKFPEPTAYCGQMTVNCQSNDGLKRNEVETENETEVENEVETEIQTIKFQKFNFKNSLIDLGIEKEIVDQWLQVRKTKKAVNTEIAFQSIKKEIEKSKLDPNECIKISVEHSWSGFKSEWLNNLNKTQNGTVIDNRTEQQKLADAVNNTRQRREEIIKNGLF